MNTTDAPDPLSDHDPPARRVRWWWLVLPALLAAAGIAWLLLVDRTPSSLPPNHPAVVHHVAGAPLLSREENFGDAHLLATTDPQETVDVWNRLGLGEGHRLVIADLPDDMTYVLLPTPNRDASGAVKSIEYTEDAGVLVEVLIGRSTCRMMIGDSSHQYFLLALSDAPLDVERYRVEFDDFEYC